MVANVFCYNRAWSADQVRVWNEIAALDLSQVSAHVRADLRWNVMTCWRSDSELDALASEMERLYRQYLFLRFKYPSWEIAPSRGVAMFWQAHVVHTELYSGHCARVFGAGLHHTPATFSGDGLSMYATAKLENLVALEFEQRSPAANDAQRTGDRNGDLRRATGAGDSSA